MKALRRMALRYPEAKEGIACKGTAVEKRTVKARDKAFLFLGVTEAMLKLGESLAEATRLASKQPSRYRVGASGWVTVTFGDGDSAPLDLLGRWIEESYRLLAPRALVASLPARGLPVASSGKTAKKRVSKKK